MEVTILCYPRHFFPLNPIHALNILLAEMQLFLGTKLVILLLRSKKKAGKSGNMMNFFFKTKKMQVKVAR